MDASDDGFCASEGGGTSPHAVAVRLTPDEAAAETEAVLDRLVSAHPGGERREGQVQFAVAAARLMAAGSGCLFAEAGTGTGKSFAYLAAAVATRRRTLVATATLALQDQLVGKDVPEIVKVVGRPMAVAVVKGRSNYVCRRRLAALAGDHGDSTQELFDPSAVSAGTDSVLAKVVAWAAETDTGDKAELPFKVEGEVWGQVSVGADACPGRRKCPFGDSCFAEVAKDKARKADIVIANTALLALDLVMEHRILPDVDAIVVDEAHMFEQAVVSAASVEISKARFEHLARRLGRLFTDEPSEVKTLREAGEEIEQSIRRFRGKRLESVGSSVIGEAVERAVAAVGAAARLAQSVPSSSDSVQMVVDEIETTCNNLSTALRAALSTDENLVVWVSPEPQVLALRVTPIAVAPIIRRMLYWRPGLKTDESGCCPRCGSSAGVVELFGGGDVGEPMRCERCDISLWDCGDSNVPERPIPVVFASATLRAAGRFDPSAYALGAPDGWKSVLAESPFDYKANSLLYVASHHPEPNSPAFEKASWGTTRKLLDAAGGRAMVLFTSRRAMNSAYEHFAAAGLPFRVMHQEDMGKTRLIEAFKEDETSVLFATMGFWQGVDVPGQSLSLVVIDKLPFAPPDDPVSQARRERVEASGANAFMVLDVPRASIALAQGVGRLIRTGTDRGLVAILDPRVVSKWKMYGGWIVKSLPPMPRTKELAEAVSYLSALRLGR
jgi:ATP-dependent DNA helicase DinG